MVSSSANTPAVLAAAGITHLFDHRIDGNVAKERNLPGKPAPDTFLAAARDLGYGRESRPSTRTPWPGWPRAGRAASPW